MREKRILIFTAGFGEGHNAAARNLKSALERAAPPETGVTAEVFDFFESCYGRMNELAKKAYLATINNAPVVWERIYELLDNTKLLELNLPAMWAMRKSLAETIAREEPDAVVSTYPVYNYLLDGLYPERSRRTFAQITIITDSITVNSVWYRCASDVFIVPNEETATVLRRAAVPEEKIRVLGFPVPLQFAGNAGSRPAPTVESGRRVLYMINFAKHEAPDLVRELLKIADIQLTVTVGRDEDLRTRVEAVIAEAAAQAAGTGHPRPHVEVHGWTPQMPELLMSHHLLISKAGGATVQEAIAAKTPMIISQVVPGQEQGNAQLIEDRRCGVIAPTRADIVAAVQSAFADDARLWQEWHRNICALSRPDAALEIARFVLSAAEKENEEAGEKRG